MVIVPAPVESNWTAFFQNDKCHSSTWPSSLLTILTTFVVHVCRFKADMTLDEGLKIIHRTVEDCRKARIKCTAETNRKYLDQYIAVVRSTPQCLNVEQVANGVTASHINKVEA